jgi:hypothetical protein
MMRVLMMMSAIVLVFGCHQVGNLGVDAGSDTDSDSDTNTDSDSDSDTNTDTDTGTDTGTDTDCPLGEYSSDFEIITQSHVAILAGYTSVSGTLHIACTSCTDLSELFCLTTVGEELWIECNDTLTNLDGLSGITSVGLGWSLAIVGNTALTNLTGLSALTSVDNLFHVIHNPSLPDCEVCSVLDQLTSTPSDINVHDNLADSCTPAPDECP